MSIQNQNSRKSTDSLNPEERALVEYLLETDQPVFVVLTEDYHPDSTALSSIMRSIQKDNPGIELIEGRYATYERFAQTQDAWGFPALFLFRKGELVQTWLGIVDEKELQNRLDF